MDFRFCDINQPFYQQREPSSILKEYKAKKLERMFSAEKKIHPFVVTCKGILGREAKKIMKRFSTRLAENRSNPNCKL